MLNIIQDMEKHIISSGNLHANTSDLSESCRFLSTNFFFHSE